MYEQNNRFHPDQNKWLNQQLETHSAARATQLMEQIIELEDERLICQRQLVTAMDLANYWRQQAGGTFSSHPFPWEVYDNE